MVCLQLCITLQEYPWKKAKPLKHVLIVLQYLDCVEINMEAVDSDVNTPPSSSPQKQPSHAPQQPPK